MPGDRRRSRWSTWRCWTTPTCCCGPPSHPRTSERPSKRSRCTERLEEVQDGRLVFTDGTTAGAIYFTSVLSLPYVIDELVPASRRRSPARDLDDHGVIGRATGRSAATAGRSPRASPAASPGSRRARPPARSRRRCRRRRPTARRRSPLSSAQRIVTAQHPDPDASTHPTVPPYRPRSTPSTASIRASASSRGCPPRAGVGDSSRASSNASGAGWLRRPSIAVPRCCTLATATIVGSGSQSR